MVAASVIVLGLNADSIRSAPFSTKDISHQTTPLRLTDMESFYYLLGRHLNGQNSMGLKAEADRLNIQRKNVLAQLENATADLNKIVEAYYKTDESKLNPMRNDYNLSSNYGAKTGRKLSIVGQAQLDKALRDLAKSIIAKQKKQKLDSGADISSKDIEPKPEEIDAAVEKLNSMMGSSEPTAEALSHISSKDLEKAFGIGSSPEILASLDDVMKVANLGVSPELLGVNDAALMAGSPETFKKNLNERDYDKANDYWARNDLVAANDQPGQAQGAGSPAVEWPSPVGQPVPAQNSIAMNDPTSPVGDRAKSSPQQSKNKDVVRREAAHRGLPDLGGGTNGGARSGGSNGVSRAPASIDTPVSDTPAATPPAQNPASNVAAANDAKKPAPAASNPDSEYYDNQAAAAKDPASKQEYQRLADEARNNPTGSYADSGNSTPSGSSPLRGLISLNQGPGRGDWGTPPSGGSVIVPTRAPLDYCSAFENGDKAKIEEFKKHLAVVFGYVNDDGKKQQELLTRYFDQKIPNVLKQLSNDQRKWAEEYLGEQEEMIKSCKTGELPEGNFTSEQVAYQMQLSKAVCRTYAFAEVSSHSLVKSGSGFEYTDPVFKTLFKCEGAASRKVADFILENEKKTRLAAQKCGFAEALAMNDKVLVGDKKEPTLAMNNYSESLDGYLKDLMKKKPGELLRSVESHKTISPMTVARTPGGTFQLGVVQNVMVSYDDIDRKDPECARNEREFLGYKNIVLHPSFNKYLRPATGAPIKEAPGPTIAGGSKSSVH